MTYEAHDNRGVAIASGTRRRYPDFRTALAGLARRIRAELAAQRDRRLLAEMSDAGLKDIGISRSEIDTAVRHGRYY